MLKLKNIKTMETFSYKYITLINNKRFEILSNFDEKTVESLLNELNKKWDELKSYKVIECLEFEYTNENDGITFDVLRNYL